MPEEIRAKYRQFLQCRGDALTIKKKGCRENSAAKFRNFIGYTPNWKREIGPTLNRKIARIAGLRVVVDRLNDSARARPYRGKHKLQPVARL